MSKNIIVIGGGLAGLAATIKIAEAGFHVDLFSMVPVKRSHSVCAQGGINSAKDMKGEGDHPDLHTTDTLFGGEYLADQPLVQDMCYEGPKIIDLLDRMGVPFNRTPEGNLDFRRFGGTLFQRTAYAGATTGQQLMYALDEQVRRFEADGKVDKYEYWEFLSAIIDDDGICRGVTAMNLWDRTVQAFKGGAVCLATGGPGLIYGKSTNSVINTGAANSRVYQQGVNYANGEFIQVHPTSIPGADKLRLISESVRGEGGRVWVPKNPADKRHPTDIPDSERDYFLERKFPKYGNLVPRDVATREIFDICVNEERGVNGENQVYLDITPERSGQTAEALERKLGGVLEIYRKFQGADPLKEPMKIFPGVHYSMGGLWVSPVDDGGQIKQMTNIPGLFAAGEADFQYHGANRLGANSLLSCIFGGFLAAPRMCEWAASHSKEADQAIYDRELKRQNEINERVLGMTSGSENTFQIHKELGEWMTRYCTVVRRNEDLEKLAGKITEFEERWHKIDINDTAKPANQSFLWTRALWDMLQLAKAIVKGATLRNECRGAHYKPDFDLAMPEKDKMGIPTDTDVYREFVAALEAQNKTTYKPLPPKSGEEVAPEFIDYMTRWVEKEKTWNKSTLATYKEGDQPDISYLPTAMTVEPPKPRIYK
ncbi:MAG: succinate dehydrogenase / fumarate reductase, flavoprotein subunit [Candidatus Sumerlaeota bacterium]|nr:succinate dehydrogenase / fumarate reductase, flavoprotein subunit [Candidatus Sumerlaeota bacterium]